MKQKINTKNGDSQVAGRDINIYQTIRSSIALQLIVGLLGIVLFVFILLSLSGGSLSPLGLTAANLEMQKIYPRVDRTMDVKFRNEGEQECTN